jgi:hypothetical protein
MILIFNFFFRKFDNDLYSVCSLQGQLIFLNSQYQLISKGLVGKRITICIVLPFALAPCTFIAYSAGANSIAGIKVTQPVLSGETHLHTQGLNS